MTIRYLQHAEIDKIKWDHCIAQSANGLIYAFSFYLDAMSPNWHALIEGDYERVLPLTCKKKYFINYLYQPFFCAQTGVFGDNITQNTVQSFLDAVPKKFKFWDIYLNKSNLFTLPKYPIRERINYILPLQKSYEELQQNYAQSHIRNIKRGEKIGNVCKKNIPIKDVIDLAMEQSKSFSPLQEEDYQKFESLYHFLAQKGTAETFGVFSRNGQLLASCAFFFSHKRAYYILVGNHPDGRTSGASHQLIDFFIRQYAGSDLLLDFEGSSINSLAFFYKGFGASHETFSRILLNRLPPIIRLLKQ